jgi:RNA methyltransferase, TrmH family
MISKNRIRFIKSLEQKKNRQQEQLFIIEGEKMVLEAIQWIPEQLVSVYYTSDFFLNSIDEGYDLELISELELKSISALKTPNKALAVCKYLPSKSIVSPFSIVLDGVQDPGNLGTILRMADWFGISHVYCSKDTVDCYNSKVLQATMGAIFRVSVTYIDLDDFFTENNKPVYGALLNGNNLFTTQFENEGIILLGNEGSGIRESNLKYIDQSITIPKFGHAESLNVATAGAIILGSVYRGI